jgi:hypothetical protein
MDEGRDEKINIKAELEEEEKQSEFIRKEEVEKLEGKIEKLEENYERLQKEHNDLIAKQEKAASEKESQASLESIIISTLTKEVNKHRQAKTKPEEAEAEAEEEASGLEKVKEDKAVDEILETCFAPHIGCDYQELGILSGNLLNILSYSY